jgi:hypothetical protein
VADAVVMGFVGDLFPRQIETPAKVAESMSRFCSVDQYRDAEIEIREVVRTACEWQGTVQPRQGMLDRLRGKQPAQPATEADFVEAARRAYERFG